MKTIAKEQQQALLELLHTRFKKHMERHPDCNWEDVLDKLEKNPSKLLSLNEMEISGGEPDVVELSNAKGKLVFADCSAESPAGRRTLCYDKEALDARKEHKPKGSAVEMAKQMGVELMDEIQYRDLQQLGKFDQKTSSWIRTPAAIRKLGGAVFCDRRYDTVFLYHNGAESYYAARGFRALLIL